MREPGIIVQPINDIGEPCSVVSPLFIHDVLIKCKSFALMYSQEDLLINSSVKLPQLVKKKECIVLTLVYLELYRPQRVMFFLYIFQPVVAVLGGNTRALFRAKGKVTGKH